MTETNPGNNLSWRMTVVEKRLDKIEEGKPDVIAERVRNLGDEVHELREEIAALRRLVIGAFVTIATGLTIAVALQNTGAF